ncbi:MAG: phosphopantetheine adenylyltransferase [Promethearchaeota archaeon]
MGDRNKSKFNCVGFAGTFDRFHAGHKTALLKALELGKKVILGLTTEELLKGKAEKDRILPFETRKAEIKRFLEEEGVADRVRIIPLKDPYGPATSSKEIEAIVATKESYARVEEINRIRILRKLAPVKIVLVPLAVAENEKPISSSRIRKGEIDSEGRLAIRKK